jgi:PAS domain S-box-containing protein
VWASGSPHLIPDLGSDPGFRRHGAAAGHGLRSGVGFPVAVGGRVVGVFDFLARQAKPPSEEDMAVLDGLAGRLGQWVERHRAETALAQSERRFRAVFEASPSGLLLIDRDGRVALTNGPTHRMFGWAADELLGEPVERLVPDRHRARHPTDRTAYSAAPAARAVGGRADLTGRRKDGTEFPVEVGLTPVETEHGPFVLASVVDITARRQAAEALRAGEERLRLALENARHGLWDWDVGTGAVHYDGMWAVVHGYRQDEVVFDYAWWESNIHPDDKPRVLAALALHLSSDDALYDVEYRARRKDGSWVWLNSRGRVQSRDGSGRAVRMMGTLHDVSERKRTESALVKSVQEKEVMLREIHHRVKNNLAVVSSLFHLQAGSARDAHVARLLREAQDRVRSMALVHEHLYNSADLGAVAFGEYAKTLATQIIQTYQLPATPVELVCNVGAVRLTVEQAIPCGLILNELLSNCLKHAFRGRDRGRVVLAVGAGAGACEVRVTDDGVGVPAELDVRLGKSLGIRLVRVLSRQLVGAVEYRSHGAGTEVRLTFPIQSPAPEPAAGGAPRAVPESR